MENYNSDEKEILCEELYEKIKLLSKKDTILWYEKNQLEEDIAEAQALFNMLIATPMKAITDFEKKAREEIEDKYNLEYYNR